MPENYEDWFEKSETPVRILHESEAAKKPSLDGAIYCDVGWPECENCNTTYMIGGGAMMHTPNYECAKCGHRWGRDFPNSEALQKGGVFYKEKEEDDRDS